jgi:hypothetical protein
MMNRVQMSVLGSLISIGAQASFLPKNNLHLEPIYGSNGMTEQKFKALIDEIVDKYRPVVESHGATLQVNYLWNDSTVNASAEQRGNTWIINMYGGLAKRPEVTEDGFSAVVCHELGHHLGGFFFYDDHDWASAEGQADYFATHSCLREVWKNTNDLNAKAWSKLSAFGVAACDRIWEQTSERNLCYRTAAAGESLAGLLAALGRSPVPKIETPDTTQVSRTNAAHPQAQCRLDTYFAGSLCKANFDPMVIPGKFSPSGQNSAATEKSTIASFCHSGLGDTDGIRPRCWFKPNVEFLLISKGENKVLEKSGNGNGHVEPGETISIIPSFKNETTDRSVSEMTATITSMHKDLTVDSSSLELPGMEPGSQTTSSKGISAKLANSVECGSKVDYKISVKSPEGSTTISDSLVLGAIEATQPMKTEANLDIPDMNSAGIISTLSMSDENQVIAAEVELNITHPYTADISADLISPKGQVFRVFNRERGADIHEKVQVDIHERSKGEWKLHVIDHSQRDIGKLDSWSLKFTIATCE